MLVKFSRPKKYQKINDPSVFDRSVYEIEIELNNSKIGENLLTAGKLKYLKKVVVLFFWYSNTCYQYLLKSKT